MHRAVEPGLTAVVVLAVLYHHFMMETSPHSSQSGATCNIETIDSRTLKTQELVKILSSSMVPLLVKGYGIADSRMCDSLDSCLDTYGDMPVGISTGAAIGAHNPDVALKLEAEGRGGLGRSLYMSIRDYTAAMRNKTLPRDAYVFYTIEGSPIAANFARMRHLFDSLQAAWQPELTRLTQTVMESTVMLTNVSTRVALGGLSTGSGWHGHGAALLAVVVGSKSWFLRNPEHEVPAWMENTWQSDSPQSTQAWLTAVMSASPTGKAEEWLQHFWYCTQSANELMFVPESMRHAIHNEEETLAFSIQVDMQVKGSPLHVTAFHGHVAATQQLLKSGASVNDQVNGGATPLHYASIAGHVAVAKLLLEAGAKLDLRDRRGATPLEVASCERMVQFLRDAEIQQTQGT